MMSTLSKQLPVGTQSVLQAESQGGGGRSGASRVAFAGCPVLGSKETVLGGTCVCKCSIQSLKLGGSKEPGVSLAECAVSGGAADRG